MVLILMGAFLLEKLVEKVLFTEVRKFVSKKSHAYYELRPTDVSQFDQPVYTYRESAGGVG